MSTTPTGNVTEYYRQITEVDIGLVARELLGPRIVEENSRLLQCDCPNHKSIGQRSLHVWLDKQGFFCHGCTVGGDVLQLVEFIQSRIVTSGRSGAMPETHQRARDFLAAKGSLPPLGQYGLSPEQLKKIEAERKLEVRVQEALTALAEFYHRRLKEAPKVLEWLHAHYGISDETIDSLQIGFAANGACQDKGKPYRGVLSALTKRKDPFKLRELAATGAFNPTSPGQLVPLLRPAHHLSLLEPWPGGLHDRTPDALGLPTTIMSAAANTRSFGSTRTTARTTTSRPRSTTATSITKTACSPGPSASSSPRG